MTIQEAKSIAIKELVFSPTPDLDANCFLEKILAKDKTYILLHAREQISPEQEAQFLSAVQKRKTGLPVAYITNQKEFYGFDFFVNENTLIPKPDTEILVEKALDSIVEKINSIQGKQTLTICDICTGSGCIGLAVYLALEKLKIPNDMMPIFYLADISEKALEVAKINAKNLISVNGSEKIKFVQSNLFQNLSSRFDFILANPPYIPNQMVQELLQDGRNEPVLALDGDVNPLSGGSSYKNDGLEIIRELIPQMKKRLNHGGKFFMEAGEYNIEESKKIAKASGFKNLAIFPDLEGQLRVLSGETD